MENVLEVKNLSKKWSRKNYNNKGYFKHNKKG